MNRFLLDTHVILWWLQGGERLTSRTRKLLTDPSVRVLVSAASAWEIAIKFKAGKLDAAESVVSRFTSILDENAFAELPMSANHGVRAGLLDAPHKDPFDRMLAAQALIEDVPIVSNDRVFDALGVQRIW